MELRCLMRALRPLPKKTKKHAQAFVTHTASASHKHMYLTHGSRFYSKDFAPFFCTLKHTHPRCSYSLTLKSKEAYLHFHQVKIPQVGAPVPPHSTSVCLCTATANNSQGEGNVLKLFFFLGRNCVSLCLGVGQAEPCVSHSSQSISSRTAGNAGS